MAFKLPELGYDFSALEPHIDAETMEIHHGKHHAGYTRKLNDAIEGTELEKKSILEILRNVSQYGDNVRNNAGGYYNHSLFWKILTPSEDRNLEAEISTFYKALERAFGTTVGFKEAFSKAASSQFGSGWAWLCVGDPIGELYVCSTPNQDNPLMDTNTYTGIPILGLDVWEHAYYLKYQNRRNDYIDAFFNLINWKEVERRYEAARSELILV